MGCFRDPHGDQKEGIWIRIEYLLPMLPKQLDWCRDGNEIAFEVAIGGLNANVHYLLEKDWCNV